MNRNDENKKKSNGAQRALEKEKNAAREDGGVCHSNCSRAGNGKRRVKPM
ncbi:hypothetical protein [Sphingobacterium faecale]|uniref:Uncharacterized protein n=1 Tax=Sphingobacterium faecale TaxID=2803775 RepID=A0ABS1R8F8_9SPHI|nr:hypothetical protein [Sphingobacterium faecale]MBL1411002.1 hypothetical protein [Sphingobacterium faecale]